MWQKIIMLLTPVAWKIIEVIGERTIDWMLAKLQSLKVGLVRRADDKTKIDPPPAVGGATGATPAVTVLLAGLLALAAGCASVSYTDSRGNSFHKVAFLANTDIGYMTATIDTNGVITVKVSKYSQDEVKGGQVAQQTLANIAQQAMQGAVQGMK